MRKRSSLSESTSFVEAVEKTVLPSGLRIVTEHVPYVQSLAIGVWINVGSRDEAPGENGISHFIEHAVFKGTASRRTHHIAQYLEVVGGYLNAFTTKDSTCYYARVMAPHLSRAVNLLADLVLHPSFPEKEILKEKQVILEEMRSIDDDPEDLIHDRFEKTLFGNHPLGQPIIGEEANVKHFTVAQLRRFVRTHYTTSNIVIVASGNVRHDALVELCAREFAGLPAGTEAVRRAPGRRTSRDEVLSRSIVQSHIVLGGRVPGLRAPDRGALSLLNTVLGDGMSSRLFQRLRERYGYAYNVYSFLSQYDDAGSFGIYAGMEQANVDRVREQASIVLRELGDRPVSVRELNRAREQVIGSMVLGMESMSTRMNRLGKDELTFGRSISVRSLVQNLEQVTPEKVRELAAKYLSPDSLASTLLVPAA